MPADQPGPAAGVNQDVLAGLEAGLASARGDVIGTSGPLRISPPEEDAFAALIGDWDPMHNDPAWRMAAGDGPIVLGFHVLARVEADLRRCPVFDGVAEPVSITTVGIDHVRFPAPFPVGAPAGSQTSVVGVARSGAGLAVRTRHRYSLEGASRPVMAGELLSFVSTRKEEHADAQWLAQAREPEDVAVAIGDLPAGSPLARASRHGDAYYAGLAGRAGQWLGATAWTCISDREAHAFALLTGDDGAGGRADLWSRAHPFQGRAVPPLQLLALRAYFSPLAGLPVLTDDSMMAFNYGVDRARWYGPVTAGTRLRDHVQLTGVQTRRPGDHLVSTRHVLEAEGNDLAVLVADCKTLYRTSS
jgi:acyl dehydratase